jgi:hypothetical protein
MAASLIGFVGNEIIGTFRINVGNGIVSNSLSRPHPTVSSISAKSAKCGISQGKIKA